jgi:hypothetical protein
MLPGFRFLFAAILLSMSVLIFGLGAAALLRAAHEEVASAPARRAPPEPVFAQQNDPTPPTLALLRVEPQPAEKPVESVTAAAEAAAEQVPDTARPAEPEKLAALKPVETAPPEAAKPEASGAELTSAAQPQPDPAEAPAPTDEPKLAAVADTPLPTSEIGPATPEQAPEQATPEQASAPAMPEMSPAASRIATLGGPAVTIEETASSKEPDAKPDRSEVKKPARTERAKPHRQTAQHARPAAAQQPADPFGLQPTMTPARR